MNTNGCVDDVQYSYARPAGLHICAYLACIPISMSRATVLLPHCRVLLYHPDSTQNTTVAVPKLSVLSTPTLLPKMKMGGQLLLESKRRMDPRLWIMKWNIKEPMAESKVEMGFTGCSWKTQD